MNVLYLDFDGVLHPEDVVRRHWGEIIVRTPRGRQLFENAELLARLLEPYPELAIVLSTSWVHQLGYDNTLERMPDALRSRCIGSTYSDTDDPARFSDLTRGAQVLDDVARRAPGRWLAIDDWDEGWEGAERNVVLTHPVDGIAEPGVRGKLLSALAALASPVPDSKRTRRRPGR